MIYVHFTLGAAFLLTGFFLLVLGATALARPQATGEWMLAFPRSRPWGLGLLLLAAGWWWYLIATIDLGEFAKWRNAVLLAIPVATVLTGLYVDELLSARALGMLVLLAAEPLLEAAFLRPEGERLFLVTLTYVAIVAAMFWIGMPYVLRDQLRWTAASRWRLRVVGAGFAVYGALLVIFGLMVHTAA